MSAAEGHKHHLREETISDKPKAPSGEPMRLEITGLRAIGIAGIVIGHYWAGIAPGAFVFIDSFFAISGFLITGLLLLEFKRKGRINFPVFWMRRARRILPAAILVLLVCIPATLVWSPVSLWDQFLSEIQASALYVENWFLALNSVDYLNMERQTSPVQHYWSLSIEEQFYIFWPFVIALACLGAKKFGFKGFLLVVLGTVTLASFAYSVYLTEVDKQAAYFDTFSRVWEITAGGLLALFGTARRGNDRLRGVISWLGLAIIFTAAFVFSPSTAFPGPAALAPVLGVMMVLWAGMPKSRLGPAWLFGSRPSRWLGDTSYSIYLWHWPLIVFAPFILDRELNTPIKIGIVVVLLLISAPTRRFIEDPVRLGNRFNKFRPRTVITASFVAIVVTVAAAAVGLELGEKRKAEQAVAAVSKLDPSTPCLGAASRDPKKPCYNPDLRLQSVPDVAGTNPSFRTSRADIEAWELRSCDKRVPGSKWIDRACRFGVSPDRAKRNIALVGDSHSIQWRPAFKANAQRQKWSVLASGKLACAWNDNIEVPPIITEPDCLGWQRDLPGFLRRHPELDTVVFATGARPYKGRANYLRQVEGYRRSFSKIPASVKRVVVIRETPRAVRPGGDKELGLNTLSPAGADVCIKRAIKAGRSPGLACATPRSEVLDAFPDPAVEAARSLGKRGSVIDLTDFFCDRSRCFPVVGGVLVFEDSNHMTDEYSRTLAPYLLREFQRVAPASR